MSNGKGDAPRNCFSDTFRDNWEDIFRKPKPTPPPQTGDKIEYKQDMSYDQSALNGIDDNNNVEI